MSGKLELIDKTTITTASASVHIANVFSSKYDTYKIVVANLTSVDSSGSQVDLRFHDGSSTITANYNYCVINQYASQAATGSVSASTGAILRFFGEIDGNAGYQSANVGYIFNPFGSGYTYAASESAMSAGSIVGQVKFSHGVLRNTNSMTGYVLYNPNRNYDEGTILTYGIAD